MLDLSLITGDSDEQNQLWLLGPVKQYKIGLLSDVGWTPQLRTWVAVLDSSIVMCIYIYILYLPNHHPSSRSFGIFPVYLFHFMWIFLFDSFALHLLVSFSQGTNNLLTWQQKHLLAHSNLRAFAFMVVLQFFSAYRQKVLFYSWNALNSSCN
jgi:hypothetical protein